jgi:leucyl aminopeptidase
MTTLRLGAPDAVLAETDVLVVGIEPAARGAVRVVGISAGLTAARRKGLEEALAAVEAKAKAGDLTRIPAADLGTVGSVLAVGLGAEGTRSANVLRSAAGVAARALSGVKKATFALPADTAADAGAVAEGIVLGSYTYTSLKGTGTANKTKPVGRVTLIGAATPEVKRAVADAQVVGDAVNGARDLVNSPGNVINPETFAAAAVDVLAELPVSVHVLDADDLAEGGYGGILGVGQGSDNPPTLVVAEYKPAKSVASLALVGKGITFDSGGLHIKPPQAMLGMKNDMGGAAAVLQSIAAIATLGLPVTVTGYMALAENMPSGAATRPGDVVVHRNGATTEVRNTDAEGRLVLADALVDAAATKPDLLVDIATLTGGQLVALGPKQAAILGRSDAARDKVQEAAGSAGESVWPLPLNDDLRHIIESDIADYGNVGRVFSPHGSTIVGGLFLSNFVPEQQEWVHMDIAGPAFADSAWGYNPVGGTGFGVRTFVQLARDLAGDA